MRIRAKEVIEEENNKIKENQAKESLKLVYDY